MRTTSNSNALCVYLISTFVCVYAQSPQAIASAYSLSISTSLPFPTSTLSSSDTNAFLVPNWELGKGRVEDDPNDLSFVSDPFANSHPPDSDATGPVLQVDYPANSFSHATGGAQFTSLFNGTQPFHSMLLSYEIAFDQNFDFVKGGKLPGLRGGPQPDGCSGGTQPTGADCFSTRLMWRTNGAAEVYAYIPPTGITCSKSQGPFICNSDFGISIDRGAFSFPTGGWSRVSLVVLLNDPPSAANGYLEVYFNDQRVISQGNLQMRTSDVIDVKGLYFSTFFGGSDSSWATPTDQHTYFRNIQLWGSTAASNGSYAAMSTTVTGQGTTGSPTKAMVTSSHAPTSSAGSTKSGQASSLPTTTDSENSGAVTISLYDSYIFAFIIPISLVSFPAIL